MPPTATPPTPTERARRAKGAERDVAVEALQRGLIDLSRRVAVPQRHAQVVARAGVDIELVASVVLSRLVDRGAMRLSDLANEMLVAGSTAGRHAAQLEADGWCERHPDPDDGRAVVVAATDAGRAVVDRLRRAHRSILADALDDWDEAELAALATGLDRLLGSLNSALCASLPPRDEQGAEV